jgi:hypothetical protein
MMTRLGVPAFLAATLFLLTVSGAQAQEDKWSIVFTPQVWVEHVEKNGFGAAATTLGAGSFNINTSQGLLLGEASFAPGSFRARDTFPTSAVYPQWGGQVAAQHGPWTFGVAVQYVSMEHRTDYETTGAQVPCSIPVFFPPPQRCNVPAGRLIATELLRTDRLDVDVTATYFFADMVKDLLDVSTGLGFKWIRASGHRTLDSAGNLTAFGSTMTYTLSAANGFKSTNHATFIDNFYGATIPTTLNFHLTRDGKWLIPVTLTPFLGYEDRADQVNGAQTSFAYGGTFDAGIRYVFDNGVAAYAGYRGQALQGNDLFLAHGPLFNMSVRFGGK